MTPEQAVKRRIRVRKEDSAYIYCILEASEGIAAYSTLPHKAGELHRDLELQIPVAFLTDVERLISHLRSEGCEVYDLGEDEK